MDRNGNLETRLLYHSGVRVSIIGCFNEQCSIVLLEKLRIIRQGPVFTHGLLITTFLILTVLALSARNAVK